MEQNPTTYKVATIGRARTKHFVPVIDMGDGRISETVSCRFSHGRITWLSAAMTRDEALATVTCRACYQPKQQEG